MQMAALLTLLRKCHSDNLLWRTLSLGRVADTYNSVFGRLTAGFNANPGSMMTPFQTSLLFKCLEAGYHTGGELSTCMRTPRKMCSCFLNSEALVAPILPFKNEQYPVNICHPGGFSHSSSKQGGATRDVSWKGLPSNCSSYTSCFHSSASFVLCM